MRYAMQSTFMFLSASLVLSCSKDPAPQPAPAKPAEAPAATPAATQQAVAPSGGVALATFKARCMVCHGENGRGDGPGAAALTVKPRNYTDPAWQKSVTDDAIKAIIVKGGGAVGKDPGMPPHPDLGAKPEVLEGLVKLVRSFAPAGDAAAPSVGVAGSSGTEPAKTKK